MITPNYIRSKMHLCASLVRQAAKYDPIKLNVRKRVCGMKTWYCPNCGEITDTRIVEREQTFSVKEKPITRTTQVRICSHCGEEIIDEDLDGATLLLFYDAYRESAQLLTSEEMCNRRAIVRKGE